MRTQASPSYTTIFELQFTCKCTLSDRSPRGVRHFVSVVCYFYLVRGYVCMTPAKLEGKHTHPLKHYQQILVHDLWAEARQKSDKATLEA